MLCIRLLAWTVTVALAEVHRRIRDSVVNNIIYNSVFNYLNIIFVFNAFRSCKMGLKCDKKAAQVSKSVLFG